MNLSPKGKFIGIVVSHQDVSVVLDVVLCNGFRRRYIVVKHRSRHKVPAFEEKTVMVRLGMTVRGDPSHRCNPDVLIRQANPGGKIEYPMTRAADQNARSCDPHPGE